jgi:hypothetical protein
VIPEIDVWRAANRMLRRYGDYAERLVGQSAELARFETYSFGRAVEGFGYHRLSFPTGGDLGVLAVTFAQRLAKQAFLFAVRIGTSVV